MEIVGWTLFGIVVALFARAIMPKRYPLGIFGTTSLAVIGALVSGWFGESMGWYTMDEGMSYVFSTAGAVLMLALYHGGIGRYALKRDKIYEAQDLEIRPPQEEPELKEVKKKAA